MVMFLGGSADTRLCLVIVTLLPLTETLKNVVGELPVNVPPWWVAVIVTTFFFAVPHPVEL